VSIAWVLHIILYILLQPPLTIFLNGMFIALDSVRTVVPPHTRTRARRHS
jgi:hypothetical protein